MSRETRLHALLDALRGDGTHRAADLARQLSVSQRTLYRDIGALQASGVPVAGTRGSGYRLTEQIRLPPLELAPAELEALSLGLAILGQSADPDLSKAATTLADRIEALLPEAAIAPADAWKLQKSPFSNAARAASHIPRIRAAIRARQKLRLTYHSRGDRITTRTIRPLHLASLGPVWTLTAWCEWRQAMRDFRLDLIETSEALPELFLEDRD
ncbi:helix-turn-helix transcriptional regulator [Pseudosulfitobacter koreensis]|uniref:WYL domain-containing protein n=1 Tax=Pseudosulfitobacter koreensis TaxID=2968472 RepID=A0ABT1Z056_9RHOB|nr:WYL domain-containing protein [Pseudosulfitobacter koreense]MCR8826492.1 WYL domain-containing protein [Pseudosulfitobacter koreense]